MALQGWYIIPVLRNEVRDFIETNHYSHNINGLKVSQCFKLVDNLGSFKGAILFGAAATTAWKKYSDSENKVIELRRLVCVDDTPKNAESFFVGGCIRWLKKHTDYETVISYADPNHGHQGTIYKASNFKYEGLTSPCVVIDHDGKTYHDRALRTKYKGKLKPFAVRLSSALLSGKATSRIQEGKHIYVYQLRKAKNAPISIPS